jgi:sulfur-oxidizing protein SoxZ
MTDLIKIRTQLQGNAAEIKILLPHPMENGLRRDEKTGQLIPAHFIQQIYVSINGKKVVEVQSSQAISRDPVFVFRLHNVKTSDKVTVDWIDNKGNQNIKEAVISNLS